ncbi:MAG: cell division protein FtsA [Candidatus Omnitrophica bacterium]|nr:cell division protein FtsA [Candidatus Omnitrophota bacterium]
MRPQLIAGLELGSRHFTVAIGEVDERHQLIVRGVESVPARGVERGVLSDPVECVDAVARLMRQAEQSLSLRAPKVLATLHGNQIKSYNASASIPVPDPTTGISSRDVDRVLTTCRTLSLDYDRQILHAFERGFAVDGQSGIKDPVGLSGAKLTVELHLVTALNLAAQNLTRVLNRAGLEVEGLVLPGLATAEAVLSDLDRDIGVTLIRIGDLQTEVLLFTEGEVRETFLIPWGTDQLAENLSRIFKLPRVAGDQLLDQVRTLEEPSVRPEFVEGRTPQADIPLRVKAGSLVRTIPQGQVVHSVGLKAKEFLTRLKRCLDETPYFRESAAGVVMVGSLARLEGFLEMAEGQLNMPVRLGNVREIQLDSKFTLSASHTTAIGLLRWGLRRRLPAGTKPSGSAWLGWLDRTRHLLEEYF